MRGLFIFIVFSEGGRLCSIIEDETDDNIRTFVRDQMVSGGIKAAGCRRLS